jgi:hypothetical protein
MTETSNRDGDGGYSMIPRGIDRKELMNHAMSRNPTEGSRQSWISHGHWWKDQILSLVRDMAHLNNRKQERVYKQSQIHQYNRYC